MHRTKSTDAERRNFIEEPSETFAFQNNFSSQQMALVVPTLQAAYEEVARFVRKEAFL